MMAVDPRTLRRLIATVQKEIEKLRELKSEHKMLSPQETHKRILGSILHDFYTGIERIFQRIATELEGDVPRGPTWHKDLLEEMAMEIPGVRPRVITTDLCTELDDYLRFRHLVRGIYGFELESARMLPLFERMDTVFAEFDSQLGSFLESLAQLSKAMEDDEDDEDD